jgi:hypothetical protein
LRVARVLFTCMIMKENEENQFRRYDRESDEMNIRLTSRA